MSIIDIIPELTRVRLSSNKKEKKRTKICPEGGEIIQWWWESIGIDEWKGVVGN